MNTKKYLLNHPDAHTVYLGWKISKGEIVVDEFGKPVKALVFAVEHKRPISEVTKPIPKKYGALPTDVVEKPRLLATPPIGGKSKKCKKKMDAFNDKDCPDVANAKDCNGCELWIDTDCWWNLPCPDTPNDKFCKPCNLYRDGKCEYGTVDKTPTGNAENDALLQTLRSRVRPFKGGVGCGHVDITTGTGQVVFMRKGVVEKIPSISERYIGTTLTASPVSFWEKLLSWIAKLFGWDEDVVEDPGIGSGGDEGIEIPLIMSNNHVLACENAAHIGDPIIQQGDYDGGRNPEDIVAHLEAYTKIKKEGNLTDVAFAKLCVDYDPSIFGVPVVNTAVTIPEIGMLVQKTGRTTGHTIGKVIGIDASSSIWYDIGECSFEDQILIEDLPGMPYFSDGGDSGSLILDLDGHPVGLLFAGGGNVTLANKLTRILEDYPIYFK